MTHAKRTQTPYEALHRYYVLQLCKNDKPPVDPKGNLSFFLRYFGIIPSCLSSIRSVSKSPSSIRIHIGLNPITTLRHREPSVDPQEDRVIDFVFAANPKRARFLSQLLADATPEPKGVKRALVYFGCDLGLDSGEFLHYAPNKALDAYDNVCSIGLYELADFLGEPSEEDTFLDTYAQIVWTAAKAKAIMTWPHSLKAESFFRRHNLFESDNEHPTNKATPNE